MDTLQTIQACQDKLKVLLEMISLASLLARLAQIDILANDPNFWSDSRAAAILMKERQKVSDIANKLTSFISACSFNNEFAASFPSEVDTLKENVNELYDAMSDLEFKQMMSGPVDDTPAILTISAGAGGSESANWVSMLLRMYVRYAAAYKFKTEILDEKRSEDHSALCTDSVSIRLEGPYAFGFFKSESGVHRLIRNSPFSSSDQRHTSFAAVSVSPDIEDKIDIKIRDEDIEISAQTSGGSGGQNRNKVASAIRLKHIPTGINIFIRTERDQLANKKSAFKILKSKLYDLELKKKNELIDKKLSELSDVSFGHQIRSYILSPHSMIKDHRTDYQTTQAEAVLDGDIHEFLLAYLRHSVSPSSSSIQ